MKRIVIEFINATAQRYPTVGDWSTDPNGDLTIRVSSMTPDASFCVAVHELIEAYLCGRAGVTSEMVDEDDSRPLTEPYAEHGDMPTARYHEQHDFAWCVERLLAHELGLDWTAYEALLDDAYDAVPKRPGGPANRG